MVYKLWCTTWPYSTLDQWPVNMIFHVNKLHSQRHGFLLHFHTLVSFKSAFLTFDRESALKKFYSRVDENLGKETSLYSINQKCVVEMSSKPRREDSELQRLYPVRFKQVYYFKNALSRSSLQLKSVERAHSFSFYCLRRNTRKLIILVVILVCCFVFHLISWNELSNEFLLHARPPRQECILLVLHVGRFLQVQSLSFSTETNYHQKAWKMWFKHWRWNKETPARKEKNCLSNWAALKMKQLTQVTDLAKYSTLRQCKKSNWFSFPILR